MEKSNFESGICKFCGQLVSIQFLRGFGRTEDADYLASRYCSCKAAKTYNAEEGAKEDELELRNITLEKTRANIEDLFGPAAADHFAVKGLCEVDERVRGQIYEAAVLVYDGYLRNATITDEQGITAKILLRGKEQRLLIIRSEGIRLQQEA